MKPKLCPKTWFYISIILIWTFTDLAEWRKIRWFIFARKLGFSIAPLTVQSKFRRKVWVTQFGLSIRNPGCLKLTLKQSKVCKRSLTVLLLLHTCSKLPCTQMINFECDHNTFSITILFIYLQGWNFLFFWEHNKISGKKNQFLIYLIMIVLIVTTRNQALRAWF